MSRFRLICPECGAAVITADPEAVVWERCPGCNRHMWDIVDARMADRVTVDAKSGIEWSNHAAN